MAVRAPALYRGLVRLHPSAFRNRFGDEILQHVADERRHRGRVPHLRVTGDLFGSLFVQGWKEKAMKNKFAVATFLVVAVAGGTFAVTGAFLHFSSILFMLGILAAIGIVYAIAAVTSKRGAEHDYGRQRFRWWWVPAGLIGAFQGLFGIGQLIDDPKLTNVFAMLVIGGFAALVFVGMTLRNRRAGNWMIATGVLPMVPFIWMVFPPILALLVIVMAMSDNLRMSRPAEAAV